MFAKKAMRLGLRIAGLTGITVVSLATSTNANTFERGIVQELKRVQGLCQVDLFFAPLKRTTTPAQLNLCNQKLIGQEVWISYQQAIIPTDSCKDLRLNQSVCQQTEGTRVISELQPIPRPKVGRIKSQKIDDIACHVDVVDSLGRVSSHYALFSLCANQLLDQPVIFSYLLGQISDPECLKGSQNCGKSPQNRAWFISEAASLTRPIPTPYYPTVGTILRQTPAIASAQGQTPETSFCWLDLITPAGQRSIEFATVNLCRQNLVNQFVKLFYRRATNLPFHPLCSSQGAQAQLPAGACSHEDVLQIVNTQVIQSR